MGDADHWGAVGIADSWARFAELASAEDPAAAGVAWSRAADGYQAYYDAYQRHLPASRWDYDYGPELSMARSRRQPMPPAPLAPRFARFVALALEGRYDEAIALVTERPRRRAERALLPILACYCEREKRAEDAERLIGWAKEATLAELAAAVAAAVSAGTGEALSHLDYPPKRPDLACITVGVEREGLWRGIALFLERGPLRAAYVPTPGEGSLLTRVFDFDDGDVSPAIAAVTHYLTSADGASPPLNIVNVVCDAMQVLWDNLEAPRGRWLPRFTLAGDAPSASIDLDGPEGVAWTDLVTFSPIPSGVVVVVAPAYGAQGFRGELRLIADVIAMASLLLTAVRALVDGRASRRA